MNKRSQIPSVKNPFLKTGDVVYVYSSRRGRYVVVSIRPDGFEAVREGSANVSFHSWNDLKRWSNSKAEILYKELPGSEAK